jgi:uncharacterized protein (DUF4415 family)
VTENIISGIIMAFWLSAVGLFLIHHLKKDRKRRTDSPECMRKEYDFSKGIRPGISIIPHEGKTKISIWIDDDVLAWFREQAEGTRQGYQTFMQAALRNYMHSYDTWFREQVQEGIKEADKPDAVFIPHEEVKENFRRQREELKARLAAKDSEESHE